MNLSHHDQQELQQLVETLEKASHHAANLYPSEDSNLSELADKMATSIAGMKADIQTSEAWTAEKGV